LVIKFEIKSDPISKLSKIAFLPMDSTDCSQTEFFN
jgi:hypothetical protein